MLIGTGIAVGMTTVSKNPYIISDSFDRPDTKESLGVADTGQTWQTVGTAGIIGGKAYNPVPPNSTSVSFITDSALTTDHTAEITISTFTGIARVYYAVIFRGVDDSNFLRFAADSGYGGHFRVIRVSGGTTTVLATKQDGSVVPKEGDVMKIVCKGLSMKCYVNNNLLFDLTHQEAWGPVPANATKCGIYMGNCDTTATIDNFRVCPS